MVFLLSIALGLALAVAWYLPGGWGMALLVLLPYIWLRLPGRLAASIFIAAYYLGFTWEFVTSAQDYFHMPGDLWAGFYYWWGLGLFHSLAWLLLYPPRAWRPGARLAMLTAALLAACLPPLGILGWAHPLLAAAMLYPALGLAGLLLAMLLMLTLGALAVLRPGSTAWPLYGLAGLLLAAALAANLAYETPAPPPGWVSVNTHLGDYIKDDEAGIMARQRLLQARTAAALGRGARLVLLPENALTDFNQGIQDSWLPLCEQARQKGALIVAGGIRAPHPGQALPREGIYLMGAVPTRLIDSRIPVPMAAWRPWEKDSVEIDLLGSGVVKLENRWVLLSVCYEETLLWSNLWPFLTGPRPQVVLSMANQWGSPPGPIRKQGFHALAWPRLWGLAWLRAVNYPKP